MFCITHSPPNYFGWHSSKTVKNEDTVVQIRISSSELMNTKNALWLFMPTQELSHGQWWSNRSTHLLQIAQCFERGVRITSQSAHSSEGCRSSTNFWKGSKRFTYPGSFELAIVKEISSMIERPVIANNRRLLFWSIRLKFTYLGQLWKSTKILTPRIE